MREHEKFRDRLVFAVRHGRGIGEGGAVFEDKMVFVLLPLFENAGENDDGGE